jgi:predicted transcriptional regulator
VLIAPGDAVSTYVDKYRLIIEVVKCLSDIFLGVRLYSMTTRQRRKQRPVGRPTTGMQPGERSSDYKLLTLRLPDDTRAELQAITEVLERPIWRVVVHAVRAYIGSGPGLTADQKREAQAKVGR